MGSERVFSGLGARELEAGRESERVPVEKSKSLIQRDGIGNVANPKSTSWGYVSHASYKRQGTQSCNLKVENDLEQANFSKGTPIRLISARSDDLHLSSKCKKLSKNGSGCSKRPRLAPIEDTHGLGQIPKQRASCGGKRSDKRTAKVLSRTKFDSFSPKNGLAVFSSTSGGHNVLGYYGLKPDLHDITKQVSELSMTEHSVEELLDDTFSCRDEGKARGDDSSETNEKMVQSIKTICSLLVPQRPSQLQASSELDGNLNKGVPTGISSASCAPGNVMHDNKESCSSLESPVSAPDFQLYHPTVVLERLSLQPSESLDSLILGDARPMLSMRDGFDSLSGKRLATQPYLPAFSWSHTFGGHCKSISDALKLSTSRSSCQGSRWAKIGHTACFCGVVSNDFTDFTKLSFNPSLVPQEELVSYNFTIGEVGRVLDPTVAASDSRTSNTTLGEHPPSLTAAAQTLCDLATQPFPPDLSRLLRKPRELQEKALKAQNFKYEGKSERPFSRPKSLLGYDSMARQTEHTIPAKKTKLTSTDLKKEATPVNGMGKRPLIWSGPKSWRSSSHRFVKDTKSENKYRHSDLTKPSIGLPPVRTLERASNSQQKPRKVVQVYWDR